MSRTRHKLKAEKCGFGKEYWKSRLHRYGEVLGKFTKKLTHKKERKQNKSLADKALKEL